MYACFKMINSNSDGMSVATSRTSAKTAGADTILGMLDDSDEEEVRRAKIYCFATESCLVNCDFVNVQR